MEVLPEVYTSKTLPEKACSVQEFFLPLNSGITLGGTQGSSDMPGFKPCKGWLQGKWQVPSLLYYHSSIPAGLLNVINLTLIMFISFK